MKIWRRKKHIKIGWNMQNFGILVNFRNKNINFKSPSITHKDDHFAKKQNKTTLKLNEK